MQALARTYPFVSEGISSEAVAPRAEGATEMGTFKLASIRLGGALAGGLQGNALAFWGPARVEELKVVAAGLFDEGRHD